MRAVLQIGFLLGLTALLPGIPGTGAFPAAAAQEPVKEPPPAVDPDQVEPATVWPIGLEKLAGRYTFVQVASPGGLWQKFIPVKGRTSSRQVSIDEVPAPLRDALRKAELVITDLKLPSTAIAAERESPSKRGKLRFYQESAEGRLAMRHLPGIGGRIDDAGQFRGRVVFRLEHQSHSNPSAVGVLFTRTTQEGTWGAATLDYADLSAISIVEPAPAGAPGKPAPAKNGVKPVNAAPAKAAPRGAAPPKTLPIAPADGAPKPAEPGHPEHEEEGEGELVINNARVLRSGVEIFSYLFWSRKERAGTREIRGSVRLVRMAGGM